MYIYICINSYIHIPIIMLINRPYFIYAIKGKTKTIQKTLLYLSSSFSLSLLISRTKGILLGVCLFLSLNGCKQSHKMLGSTVMLVPE